MKKIKVWPIVLVVVAIVLLSIGCTMWSQRNTAVKLENRVQAQYKDNQNTYDNMWKKFKELTQVTDLQAKQFKDVYMDLISGRNQDENLLFKSVQESNPQLSTDVYIQLQREISAGRETFKNSQTKLLDIIREYNDYVQTKMFMIILGKKPLDMDEYIVTSDRTDDAFNEKKDDQINLFE